MGVLNALLLLALWCAMPVNWVRVEMPLGGVSTLADPVHVLPGKLLTLENGRFEKPGGISKRPGYVARSLSVFSDTPTILTSGVRLAEMADGEQLLFDLNKLYAWDGTTEQWVSRGRVGDAFIFSDLAYFDSGFSAINLDVAQANGTRVLAWSGGEFQHLVATSSTTVIKGTLYIGQVFAVGDNIWCLRNNGTSIEYGVINSLGTVPLDFTFSPTGFAVPALTSLAANSDLVKGAAIGTTGFAVLYPDNTDANQLHVSLRNNTVPPSQFGANWDSGETADECTAIYADGAANRVYVAWSRAGAGIRFAVLNATTGVQIGATLTVDNQGNPRTRLAMTRLISGQVILCWEQAKGAVGSPPSERLPYVRWCRVSDAPAVQGTIRICSDVAIAGKPWVTNGQAYLPVVHTGAGYGVGLIVQVANTTPVELDPSWRGTFARDTAEADLDDDNTTLFNPPSTSTVRGFVSNTVDNGAGGVVFAVRSRERFEVAKLNDDAIIIGHTGVRAVTVTPEASNRNWVTWGKGLFQASGRPSWYDGAQCAEHGFAWQPSVNRDTPEDLTPILLGTGTFPAQGNFINIQLIWHFQDFNGQIQQSEPSAIFGRTALTPFGAMAFRVELRNTLLTDRAPLATWTTGVTKAKIQVYRTTAGVENPPGTVTVAAGTIFYRGKVYAGYPIPDHGTATSGPTTGGGTTPATALILGANVSVGETDADIVNNEVLYTTGGILPNTGTPPCELCLSHGNRVWLAGLEDPRELWFSQPFVEQEAPRFNGALKLRLPESVRALGELDDKLIVGSPTSIYIVTGRGCGASGDIDIGFNIEKLASDLGCTNHRSMVNTPIGLMMHTTRGFMLLDRSLQLQDIGAPVQGLFSRHQILNVSCGTLIAGQAQVRWLANLFDSEEETVGPVAFVYDYRVGEWSFDRFGIAATVGMDAAAFDQKQLHSILTFNGRVFDENLAAVSSESFFPLTMETPWIRLDTIQGWQRVRSVTILGRKPADHSQIPASYNIAVGYDYQDNYSQLVSFTDTDINAMPGEVMQMKVRFARQKCEAFRLLIQDAQGETGGLGIGAHFSSLVFESGLKRGTMKLPAEQKR